MQYEMNEVKPSEDELVNKWLQEIRELEIRRERNLQRINRTEKMALFLLLLLVVLTIIVPLVIGYYNAN